MRRGLQGALLCLIGAVVLYTVASGTFVLLVREQMRWPLVATALVLVAAGTTLLVLAGRSRGHRVSWVGALLAAPFLAIVGAPVTPLSAWSADRATSAEVAPPAGLYGPLEAGDVIPLRVTEFVARASYDTAQTLKGRTVRMTGFVSSGTTGWSVARLHIQCCVGDAKTNKVEVVGAPAPPHNSWVEVVGTWIPDAATPAAPSKAPKPWPRIKVTSVKPIPAPSNPYQ